MDEAILDEKTSARIDQITKWNADHAIPGGPQTWPVQGFGPDGAHTLFLASPRREIRTLVRDRKMATEVVPGQMTSPAMLSLMANTLTRMVDPKDVLPALVEYACAVIEQSYAVDDNDLTDLLCGVTWHNGMVQHLLGDGRTIAALSGMPLVSSRRRASPPADVQLETAPPAAAPITKPAKRSTPVRDFMKQIFRR